MKLKVRSQKKQPLEVKKESGKRNKKWEVKYHSRKWKKSRMWKKFELKKGFEMKWNGSIKKKMQK